MENSQPHPIRVAPGAAGRGFTLVEILVVLAIIGLIVGGVAVVAGGAFTDAQGKTARNEVVQIEQASEMFMIQKSGKCPKSIQDLKAGGVLKKVKKDPWKGDYMIKCPGEHSQIDVSSPGPDGELGTADDINSWDEEAEGSEKKED